MSLIHQRNAHVQYIRLLIITFSSTCFGAYCAWRWRSKRRNM